MHLILTHEQGDFDALASLLGASLANEGSLPVLPGRINENVRSFINHYETELPFIGARELPRLKVKNVTLVDTQSLGDLKGLDHDTCIRVVDHHPQRPGLQENWDLTIEKVGATITMLIEVLQNQKTKLSSLQATLFLLGIYEDTGSLTYSHTTSRDVYAAGWLLEQGASLKIAGEYLNPPLSVDQIKVYDDLLEKAQTHQINGHRVVIAYSDASIVNEEISPLAHKLRDLLDPDALFVLVTTPAGIRIVARSTSDSIDVSKVMALFDGGGHDRAASALIRTMKGQQAPGIDEACKGLLKVLPKFVKPSVTIAQIMSRGAHVLAPNTPVKQVAQLMQRTGFEGYPVVEKGRVIGLLNRRAVDRAVSHKLELTAASLMEAGEVTVRVEDSLQHLQSRMLDTGWGQVPVVNSHKEVIGIVTRTDLLKTLSAPMLKYGMRNLASRLKDALQPARLELIQRVADLGAEKQMAVYIVGGFVRDLLLEKPSLDFDMVVEGDAIALGKLLAKKYGGRVTSHARFGTAKWFLLEHSSAKPSTLDLISARTEFYEHPTALPTVQRGSIKLDLHRRDFTINTLALRLDGHYYGELQDHWGGLGDLERGIIRVLHSLSFVDDPTRMLRAVRYEQRYGFEIEARTLELMEEAIPLLEKLSSERLRHELDWILDEPNWFEILTRLDDLELLRAIHSDLGPPEFKLDSLKDDLGSLPSLGVLPSRRTLAWLMWLTPADQTSINKISRHLRFPTALRKLLLAASGLCADLPSLKGSKPSGWVSYLDNVPELAILAVTFMLKGKPKHTLNKYLKEWRQVQPKTRGSDLKKRGLPPGPKYQSILDQLRNAWLDGKVKTLKGELALLEKLIR